MHNGCLVVGNPAVIFDGQHSVQFCKAVSYLHPTRLLKVIFFSWIHFKFIRFFPLGDSLHGYF